MNGTRWAPPGGRRDTVNGAGPLRFGGNGVWSEWFAGRIDEIRVYGRALTQAEVQSDMATPVTCSGSTPPQPALARLADEPVVLGHAWHGGAVGERVEHGWRDAELDGLR